MWNQKRSEAEWHQRKMVTRGPVIKIFYVYWVKMFWITFNKIFHLSYYGLNFLEMHVQCCFEARSLVDISSNTCNKCHINTTPHNGIGMSFTFRSANKISARSYISYDLLSPMMFINTFPDLIVIWSQSIEWACGFWHDPILFFQQQNVHQLFILLIFMNMFCRLKHNLMTFNWISMRFSTFINLSSSPMSFANINQQTLI